MLLFFLSKIFLQLDYLNPFDDPVDVVGLDDQIAGVIDICIAALSIFLAYLAYVAYKRSKLSQLKFVVVAFSMFTGILLIEATQEFLPLNDDSFDMVLSVMMLLILISFFCGIMRKQIKEKLRE